MSRFHVILLFNLTFCCKQKEQKNFTHEQQIIAIIHDDSRYISSGNKAYLVTALDGCGTCLEHTVKFIEGNISNEQITFIISGRSETQLKSKFRKETICKSNFIVDTALVALKQGLVNDGFPKIFLFKKGKIVESYSVPALYADSLYTYSLNFVDN